MIAPTLQNYQQETIRCVESQHVHLGQSWNQARNIAEYCSACAVCWRMTYAKTIETARLTLRIPRRGDAADLYALHSDPEVMRYFSEPPWTDPARALRQIDEDAARFENEESFRFAIILNETGRQIGNCTLYALHRQNRRADIGYALARGHWGRGYMQEALQALVAFGFTDLNLHRLEADVDPRNTASATALTRLGFVQEGLLRERWIVAGEVSDSALFGLLRRDWEMSDRKAPPSNSRARSARPAGRSARE